MEDNECTLIFCNRKHYARGLCHTHYTALRRYGSPYGKHREEMERINDILRRMAEKIYMASCKKTCPFCGRSDWKHDKECISWLSMLVIEVTR